MLLYTDLRFLGISNKYERGRILPFSFKVSFVTSIVLNFVICTSVTVCSISVYKHDEGISKIDILVALLAFECSKLFAANTVINKVFLEPVMSVLNGIV